MESKDYYEVAEQMLKELFWEDWMEKEDWEEFENTLYKATGLTREKLGADIVEGVKRGYPIEKQIKLLKIVLKGVASGH